jgi:antitoxin component HigA of HigAB toxin-antitoxin module
MDDAKLQKLYEYREYIGTLTDTAKLIESVIDDYGLTLKTQLNTVGERHRVVSSLSNVEVRQAEEMERAYQPIEQSLRSVHQSLIEAKGKLARRTQDLVDDLTYGRTR